MTAPTTLYVGQRFRLPEGRFWRAVLVAAGRYRVGASDTRGAGRLSPDEQLNFWLKGTIAEDVPLFALHIARPPELLNCTSNKPDVPEAHADTCPGGLEIKCGVPLEAKTKLRDGCLYVNLSPVAGTQWREWVIARLCAGHEIRRQSLPPHPRYCKRPNTETLNWEIPAALQEATVYVQ